MTLLRVIHEGRYCVVEDMVHECVTKEGEKKIYEHFLKTWVIETEKVPKELFI